MLLSDLFHICRGLSSSRVDLSITKSSIRFVPYLRPASQWKRLVAGYVDPNQIPKRYQFSSNAIMVSTDGAGSHTYSYVIGVPFVPNSNVAVLQPKQEMNISEKMFYAMCISSNRWLFSYGRKPKAGRLANIELPKKPPDWIYEVEIPDYESVKDKVEAGEVDLNQRTWKLFNYTDLFDIKRGSRVVNSELNEGETPFIRPLKHSNGYSAFIDIPPNHEGNTISVNYDSQGGVGYAFYQPVPYFAIDSVNVFYPKFELTPEIGMFLVTLIRKERFRFSYGRKWNTERMKKSAIKLPVDRNGDPDWDFMQRYIEGLPFSSAIIEQAGAVDTTA